MSTGNDYVCIYQYFLYIYNLYVCQVNLFCRFCLQSALLSLAVCVYVRVSVTVPFYINKCCRVVKIQKNRHFQKMAQVQFFSSLTLTLILKVKLDIFYFVCEYLINGEMWSKYYSFHQIRGHVFVIELHHCECCAL